MRLFARRLSRDLSCLEASARHLADKQLPQVVRSLRDHGPAAEVDRSWARPSTKTTEIARTAAAITGLQQTAIAAARTGPAAGA